MAYIHKSLVAIDQAVNVLFGGHDDETMSARIGRAAQAGRWWGRAGAWVLNTISPGHTDAAIANDLRRAELVVGVEEQAEKSEVME